MKSIKSTLVLFFVFFNSLVFADQESSNDTRLEITFGTSQMYVEDLYRQDLITQKDIILPTTSAVAIAEYLWNDRWGTMAAVNLPLSTKTSFENGQLVEKSIAESYLFGQRYSPFLIPVSEQSMLSTQVALGLTILRGDNPQITPSLSGRLHIVNKNGFSMYLGNTVTYGIKGNVLYYGVGNRF